MSEKLRAEDLKRQAEEAKAARVQAEALAMAAEAARQAELLRLQAEKDQEEEELRAGDFTREDFNLGTRVAQLTNNLTTPDVLLDKTTCRGWVSKVSGLSCGSLPRPCPCLLASAASYAWAHTRVLVCTGLRRDPGERGLRYFYVCVCLCSKLLATWCRPQVGQHRKNWKKRWFVFDLPSSSVRYFESEKAKADKGGFCTSDVVRCFAPPPSSDTKERYLFIVEVGAPKAVEDIERNKKEARHGRNIKATWKEHLRRSRLVAVFQMS